MNNEIEQGDVNPFDPANFVVSSPLNGQLGQIVESNFIRHNYNGNTTDEHTALRLVARRFGDSMDPSKKDPWPMLLGADPLFPAVRGEDGKLAKSNVGPFLVGGKIDKSMNFAEFQANAVAAGFPVQEMATKGAEAFVGAVFEWKAVEKMVGKGKERKNKIYDMPARFVGFEPIPEVVAVGEDEAPAPAATATAEDKAAKEASDAALRELTAGFLRTAVETYGEIPRAQLSIKVGPMLKDHPQKPAALALLLKDEFLSSVSGVAYDKKKVSKA